METIEIRNNDNSSVFVAGFGQYTSTAAGEHLVQFLENYRIAFGEEPSPEQLTAALKFAGMFIAEVGESKRKTQYSAAASILSSLVEDDAIATAERIAEIPT